MSLYIADILTHMSTQSHRQGLDAATDAENRQLTIIGQLGDKQFRQIALLVNSTQCRPRFLTSIVWVVVGTTTEYQSIEAF